MKYLIFILVFFIVNSAWGYYYMSKPITEVAVGSVVTLVIAMPLYILFEKQYTKYSEKNNKK